MQRGWSKLIRILSKYDEGVLAFSDEDKKIAWKNYHEKLLNTDFAWHRNSLSQEDTISSIPHLTKT